MHRPLISLLSCLLVASSARAQVIEQVVATLDDEPIYATELMARAGDDEADRSTYRALLDRMIEERLIAREARRLSVVVDDAEVELAFQNVRLQNDLVDDQALVDVLEEQGYTRERYLAELRLQLLRLRLVQLLARDELDVDEVAMRRLYDERIAAAGSGIPVGDIATFEELRDGLRTELINRRMQRAEERIIRQLRRRALVISRI